MTRNYGWRPSPPDQRDIKYRGSGAALPEAIDLRERVNARGARLLGKAWQQGGLGSCQSHAAGKAWYYTLGVEGHKQVTPSRLFVYYNARSLEGTTGSDVGATIRDTVKGLATYGAPAEKVWPYKPVRFDHKPPAAAYDKADRRLALQYQSVPQDDGTSIKSSLAEGYPVIVGFTVYSSGMPTEQNGYFQSLPRKSASILGYHAVLVVGYTHVNDKPSWIILDSDGTWQNDGYWYMDERYLTSPDLSADFWTLRKVGRTRPSS